MSVLFSVAVGGSLGAVARYGLKFWISSVYITAFINILGSFLMGLALAWFEYSNTVSETWRMFIVVGILGSFTTFSTFSAHIFQLFEQGLVFNLLVYLLLSVMGAILAFCIGFYLMRQGLL